MANEKILGTWLLRKFEVKSITLNKSYFPYGQNPLGTLLFNEDGYMSAAVMSDNRKDFNVDSLQIASTEEKASATETYLSYSGQWRIEDNKIFVKVMISLLPNWTSKEHFRMFDLSDDVLLLETPKFKIGELEVFANLTWEKAK